MKIILTGATGFLGGWLISELLNKSFEVVVLRSPKGKISYQSNSQYFIKKFSKYCREEVLNLLDYSAVEKIIKEIKPDVVIHMAAVGDITVARDNPKYTYETSSNSTLNLLEAISQPKNKNKPINRFKGIENISDNTSLDKTEQLSKIKKSSFCMDGYLDSVIFYQVYIGYQFL